MSPGARASTATRAPVHGPPPQGERVADPPMRATKRPTGQPARRWDLPFVQAARYRHCDDAGVIRRILPYADTDDTAASRDFYVGVLGLDVAMEDPVLALRSPDNPTAQVIVPPRGMHRPEPRFGVDVGEPAAVDAAHAEALRRGFRVVYPLTDEPWGVRRFFVEDPGGTVINVLAHLP